ncbi:DUF3426 domain-containing protein [Bosea sp. PAMC 26642]|uniref:DUF3426 domain-containing protein n=1 Tax=Bosea sp. (strain PAMC 26642) TaxID=1792307 RepID=UPI00077067EA|nr:DUF3426 domain-containing protein [Bosea sp. PAMC 26642]AMJ61840.1 hypothetical protein AXW83_17395 [Bosea sp. PAMC 26642]
MLIVCPSCASRYELEASKLGQAGRTVRCAKCDTRWHVEPLEFPPPPSAEETQALLSEELQQAASINDEVSAVASEMQGIEAPEPDQAPLPIRKRSAGKKDRSGTAKPRGMSGRGIAAPAAVTALGLAVFGGLVWQRDLAVRAAPQLASVFQRLGLSVNVRGLSLTAIESGLVQDAQGRFLVVEGDVTNIARNPTAMPPIEVAVKDAGGQTLYTWTTDPPRPSLDPSELVRFRARLASPPENGQSVQVRFTSAKPTGIAGSH